MALIDDPFEAAKAQFFAALARQQAGDLDAAERHYRAALALVPGRASTLINLAAVQLRLGRPADALANADAALAAERDSVDAWLHRAHALAQLGAVDEALASFDRLLALDPHHAAAWSGRGTLLRELHRLDDAAHSFHEAVRHGADPTLHDFYLASVGAGAAPAAPPREYVAGLFDDYAETFEEHLVGELRYGAPRQLIDRVVACAGADARFDAALDLGCGTGLCGPLVRPMARRLSGVDLSARMIEKARALGVYDRLEQADIVEFLAASDERWDLVVAADVFIYVGDLGPVFARLEQAMTRGLFGFSVEALDADDGVDLRLLPSLRYAHAPGHVAGLAAAHGFAVESMTRAPVREDQGRPVDGLYVVLRRRGDAREAATADGAPSTSTLKAS